MDFDIMYYIKMKFKCTFVLLEVERKITLAEKELSRYKEDNELIENDIKKYKLFKDFMIDSEQEYIELSFETYCNLME